jgi:hypothetical protein
MEKQALNDEPKKHKKDSYTFYPELSGAGDPDLIKKRITELKGAIKALSKDAEFFSKEIQNLQSYVDLFENMIGKKKADDTEKTAGVLPKKANQLDTMTFKKKKENEGAYYSKAIGDKGYASKLTKRYKPQGRAFPKIAAAMSVEAGYYPVDEKEKRRIEILLADFPNEDIKKKIVQLAMEIDGVAKDLKEKNTITKKQVNPQHIKKYIDSIETLLDQEVNSFMIDNDKKLLTVNDVLIPGAYTVMQTYFADAGESVPKTEKSIPQS